MGSQPKISYVRLSVSFHGLDLNGPAAMEGLRQTVEVRLRDVAKMYVTDPLCESDLEVELDEHAEADSGA